MKALVAAVSVAFALLGTRADAQIKGPRSYFPKNYQAPPAGSQGTAPSSVPQGGNGMAGSAPAANAAAAAKPPPIPKFKDVQLNSQFFFLSDTNHEYPWMKISTSTATNVKNGVVRPINPETAVQR